MVAVENHSSCRTNAEGEFILPNEHAWRPDTVLKIIMSRLLARADKMLDMPVRVTCIHITCCVLCRVCCSRSSCHACTRARVDKMMVCPVLSLACALCYQQRTSLQHA